MNQIFSERLKQNIIECDRHKEKILTALNHLSDRLPFTVDIYKSMDDTGSGFLDQLIFRYTKLQDTMGERILPAVLQLGSEDTKKKTFIDILNRLEQLEIVTKDEWLELREFRNQVAHEYADNDKETVVAVNHIAESSKRLIQIYDHVRSVVWRSIEKIT
jgi:hypothetical protein